MRTKKIIPKVKLKIISNRDVLRKLATDENIKKLNLIKIFSYNHQKQHQIYSKNENHVYNKDDEKYTSIFPKMKKYNEIYYKNISNYHKKKDENKNFYKQYLEFKKNNKEICNDGINFLYGNLLPKYSKRNLEFSKKFLSGEKLFKENGLLMKKKSDIDNYYSREIKENGENSQNTMRDIIFINELYNKLDKKLSKFNSEEKNNLLIVEAPIRRKSCVAEMLEKYTRTHAYKKLRKVQAMEAAKIVRMKQQEIEDDEKYIKNISELIEKEEDSREKVKTIYPYKKKPISLIKNNNNENENTLFIINRYTNNNYKNFKGIVNDESKRFDKNKSTGDLFSSLYREKDDTTNSTFMNINDTKNTLLSRKLKNIIDKKNSIKSTINYSNYSLEDNNITMKDYIMIKDNSNLKNGESLTKVTSLKQNKNITIYSSENINFQNYMKKLKKIKDIPSQNNEELSSISHFDKNNLHNLSSYTNMPYKKAKTNVKIYNIKNTKLSSYTFKDKKSRNINNKNERNFSLNEEDLDKKELKWELYKKYVGLRYKLESCNNHKFENFCNTFSFLPKIINDNLNKSYELDEQIKETHQKYIKLLMEKKIKAFDKNECESTK